jgi:hypothetical protein
MQWSHSLRPSFNRALSLSSAIRANHYPDYVQNHQLSCLGTQLHLCEPIHQLIDDYASEPSHALSFMQGCFLAKARELVSQRGPDMVIGSTILDVDGLVEPPNTSIGDATDVQTWSKAFIWQFDLNLADRVAFTLLVFWYMRVSLYTTELVR